MADKSIRVIYKQDRKIALCASVYVVSISDLSKSKRSLRVFSSRKPVCALRLALDLATVRTAGPQGIVTEKVVRFSTVH